MFVTVLGIPKSVTRSPSLMNYSRNVYFSILEGDTRGPVSSAINVRTVRILPSVKLSGPQVSKKGLASVVQDEYVPVSFPPVYCH